MKESYFDKVNEILRKVDEENLRVYANVYEDGDNDGEQILVISDTASADTLNELFTPIVKKLCKANDDIFREYSNFALDYITEDQWTFDDEGYMCSDCYKFYRYNYSGGCSYANYFVGDGFIVCENCLRENYKAEYLDELIDNPKKANTILTRDELTELGFEKVNDYSFENGMYEGQNDNPTKIYEKAKEKYPESEFLFSIVKDYNPFQTVFDLYKREVA